MQQAVRPYAGHDQTELVSVHRLAEQIAADAVPGAVVRLPLDQAAGHILARPLCCHADFPTFDRAMMDGFAVRAADAAAAPIELRLVEPVAAGDLPSEPLPPGHAARINTGAPLPPGADAVVIVERADVLPDGRVRLGEPVQAGRHVMRRGTVCRAGQEILAATQRLSAVHLGAAASAGASHLDVFEPPALALLVTGSELAAAGETLPPGRIYDSNGPTLRALARQLGAAVRDLGRCEDDPALLRDRLASALRCPIVVAVGGMAVGTRDLVPAALADLGVTWKVHGVDMRPGRPTGYGVGPDGQQVFGLPGNPVSCFVGFLLFVKLAIDGRCGLTPALPRPLYARLTAALRASSDPRPAYLPARLAVDAAGQLTAAAVEWQGSGDPIGLARANALLCLPRGGAPLPGGAAVDVIPLDPARP